MLLFGLERVNDAVDALQILHGVGLLGPADVFAFVVVVEDVRVSDAHHVGLGDARVVAAHEDQTVCRTLGKVLVG